MKQVWEVLMQEWPRWKQRVWNAFVESQYLLTQPHGA